MTVSSGRNGRSNILYTWDIFSDLKKSLDYAVLTFIRYRPWKIHTARCSRDTMRQSTLIASLVAALPAVNGVAFGGPAPTAIRPERALEVSPPVPTQGPLISELKKRQTNLFPATCGWIDGDLCT